MYPDASSRSARLFERAQRVLPGGNTRHTVAFDPYPLYAASGAGCKVVDVDGVERTDFINNYSSMIHGHSHPKIVEAVRRQAAEMMAVGLPTESEILLAELLVERLPSVEQVRFCNSGTEAVMFAVRAARAFTGKPKLAKVEGAYHGAYDYVQASLDPTPANWGERDPVAVGHAAGTPERLLSDVVVIPFNDVEATARILDANKAELAGVLFDPIVARMGFLEATPAYLRLLREWTRANGALLLIDEVFTFRVGYDGAQGRYGIEPDLTALGKIIGGGLPIGAVGGRRDIMSVFDHRGGHPKVPHGGTYNGNPLAMVAGRVSMELLTKPEIERINRLGDRLRDGITRAIRESGLGGRANGVGSMVAMMLDDSTYTNYRGFLPAAARSIPLALQVHQKMLNRGVLFIPSGGFIVSTAMDEATIDETLAALSEVLSEVARSTGAAFAGAAQS
ncbi:MAG: aspartate aminotransferase family protein [Candidatus Eremiobacteraeota bacterium]|nr:aspartate aminotransferase family protein [Candidatus Eremiobacteraeota bacterium]